MTNNILEFISIIIALNFAKNPVSGGRPAIDNSKSITKICIIGWILINPFKVFVDVELAKLNIKKSGIAITE